QPPADRKIDGHDITPLLYGVENAQTPYEVFYYYHLDQLQAVRSGPWKLFLPVEYTGQHPHFDKTHPPQPLLFNVVEDIASEHNVAAEHPEIVARLNRLADAARKDLGDTGIAGRGQRAPGKVAKVTPRLLE
ncbi:MAG: arylsulfatase, partial [Planctomycetales bacterium]|nr:arylsulfatase [Planctomycetales bacterium]